MSYFMQLTRQSPDESVPRRIIESIEHYAIYMLDSQGRIATWNIGAAQNKGYTAEEVIGRPYSILFTQEDIDAGAPERNLAEAREHGSSKGEGWRLRKNGERFWVSYVLTAIRDENGDLVGYSKVAHDITDRKLREESHRKIEETLRNEAGTLRAAVESSVDAFFVCQSIRNAAGAIVDFTYTYVNPIYEKLVLIPVSTVVGARMRELFRSRHTSVIFQLCKWVSLTGNPMVHETQVDDPRLQTSWLRLHVVKLHDGVAVTVSDLSGIKENELKSLQLANHDPLTGLPNRRLLADRFHQATKWADRQGTRVALVVIDLNNFKQINDSLGHAAGDAVLVNTAQRLKAALRESDSIFRTGGDEFVVILPGIVEPDDLESCYRKIVDALRQPLASSGHTLDVSGSAGLAVYPDSGKTVETLMASADAAMYTAKRTKNRRGVFALNCPSVTPA